MMNFTREQIIGALETLLTGASSFKYVSRILKSWDAVPQDQRPALFIVEGKETWKFEDVGQPPRVWFDVTLFIYTWAKGYEGGGPNDVSPMSILNPILDNLTAALAPPPLIMRQNLGQIGGIDVVYNCYIDGELIKGGGDIDGDGIAIVPLKLLIPA